MPISYTFMVKSKTILHCFTMLSIIMKHKYLR